MKRANWKEATAAILAWALLGNNAAFGAVNRVELPPSMLGGPAFSGFMEESASQPVDLAPLTDLSAYSTALPQTFPISAPIAELEPSYWGPRSIADRGYAQVLEAGSAQLSSGDALLDEQPAVLKEMEKKDPATHAHLMRVGILAGMVARAMGYSEEEARRIGWGARLHDAGKLEDAVHALIHKKGALTPEERRIVEQHPEIGAEILVKQTDLTPEIQWTAMLVALRHHEKFDGTGYPVGLSGDKIPIEARITTVVDYLDALLENRSYRAALTIAQALEIMEKAKAGFDPKAYAALRYVIGRGV